MTHSAPRAFTLVELVAVMTILAVLSLAAIPSLGTLSATRRAALGNELERRLLLARSWAATTGQPAALRIDLSAQRLEMLRIQNDGDAPTPLPSSTGATDSDSTLQIGSAFAGASVLSVSLTPSTDADTALWFSHNGTPQVRRSNGKLLSDLTSDALISLSGGATVTVRRLTGVVEK